MKVSDLLSLSLRTFKTRPMRTFLTVLGVSVGIGTVLFLVSLGYGLQNIILSRITTADALLSLDVSAGSTDLITLTKKNLDEISALEQVDEVSPVANLSAQLTIGDLTGDGLVYGVEPSYFRLGGITTEIGEGFHENDVHEVVLSSAGAEILNLDPKEAIGQLMAITLFIPKINEEGFEEIKVVKRDNDYKIVGIVQDPNTNYIFMPLGSIADLNIDEFTQAKVKVKQDEFLEGTREIIVDMGFLVSSLSDTIDQAKKIFGIIQLVLALFGFVALVVSAIGMINTMTIALLERINEIGIMRSIGASSSDIKMLFLIESLMMGFLGGVGGVAIGYLAGEIANLGINFLAKNFGGQSLDLFYRPLWFVGAIIVSSSFIGLLTGIYPSRRASNLNPLAALRYK